jgi:hypothetical protein
MNINNVWQDILNKPLEYITLVLAVLGASFTPGLDANLRGLGFLCWVFSNGWMLFEFMMKGCRGRENPGALALG